MEVGPSTFQFGEHQRLNLFEVLGDGDDFFETALDYAANGVHLGFEAEVGGVLLGFDAYSHQRGFDECEVFIFVAEVVAALN